MAVLFGVEAEWEYQAADNTAPVDPAAVEVPSADWLGPAPAPFGTLGTLDTYDPINTAWATDTGLWIRRNVELDGHSSLLLRGRIEQACYVYFAGNYVGAINPANSSRQDVPEWRMVIPVSLIPMAGTYEIALLCLDESGGDGGDTTYIFVEAETLPVLLPLQPQAPVKETLSWLTDVMISEDGSEDRVQSRLVPRQALTYSYPVSALEQARALNMVYGARQREWLVPVWTEAQRLGAIAAGLYTIPCEPDYSDFREFGGLALLWQSTNHWQVVGIDTIGGSSIVVSNVTEAFTDAWLMPVRRGHVVNNPAKTFTGHRAEYSITYEIDDNVALSPAAPTQYLGDDILYDETLLSGDTSTDDIITRVDAMDEELGLISYRFPWLNNRIGRTHRALAEGAQEAWELREWLHRRAGRFRQFWQPSFEADMRVLSTGTITDQLVVASDEYRAFADMRTHIAIEAGGSWYPRAITAATQLDADRVQLTLDSAVNVPAASINRVSYLGLKRLDTDRVEISWVGGGVCTTEVRLIEIQP